MSEAVPLPGTMPGRTPENAPQPADFDPVKLAKSLLRSIRAGTLATLDRHTGHPFASLVNVATDLDGAPLILVSKLATHTANLEVDGRASLLFAATGKGDPLAHPRLTVLGKLVPIPRGDDDARVRRRFLARHPKAEMYAGFADFAFWRMDVASAHLNGGFARAADLKATDVLSDLGDAQELVEAEAGAVEHMNADHAEAVRLYAVKLLGEADGAWRLTGLDPDGLDLALGDRTARLAFDERVIEAGQLRKVLVALAQQARAI
ncbi:MAG: pyridoxamine 5-phosphate oxidase [Xanthobacteraceae bacterium]|jgi:putative heme iron utilization protein|nr:pyridoxamine 5-phosphate oxidase [Xanthobacteraceae bacterium]